MICEILEMVIGEKTILEFEHSKYLADGDSLTGAPTVVESSGGSIISLGAPNISGTKVLVLVTAIASGKSSVTCTADTTLGALSIDDQDVFVE